MRKLAIISLHTSPLLQPGAGDSGGMNVYVRELAGSLARAGVPSVVYTRRWSDALPPVVRVEPGVEVVHVPAGPPQMAKEDLPLVVDELSSFVAADIVARGDVGWLHAHYWLSGVAGHRLKHELDLPLVTTFHTLGRVKAVGGDAESHERVSAEDAVIGCSDVVTASSPIERAQLEALYGMPAERIELVPPGVDRAFFSPGDRRGARWALGLGEGPVLLFVGRIQPLKGLDVAVRALAELDRRDARLVVIGGPSGPDGADTLEKVGVLIDELDLGGQVLFRDPQPHHLLSTWYRASDVCVVPSRSESFGLVALEAAACGVPVVATDVGGLSTLVEHGRTGFLVPERDPVAFAEHIERILVDPLLASSMGVRASRLASGYTWSATAELLRDTYLELNEPLPLRCAS